MINPWGDYIAVTDPPAAPNDGTYKGTGLVIPEGFGSSVLDRAIVLGVGPAVEAPDGFEEGSTVFYPHGATVEVGDRSQIKFVRQNAIIAWEPALDREGVS